MGNACCVDVDLSSIDADWKEEQSLTGEISSSPSTVHFPRGLLDVTHGDEDGIKIMDANNKIICKVMGDTPYGVMHIRDRNDKPLVTVHTCAPKVKKTKLTGATVFTVYTYRQNYPGQVSAKKNADLKGLQTKNKARRLYEFAKLERIPGIGTYFAYSKIGQGDDRKLLCYLVIEPDMMVVKCQMVTTLKRSTAKRLAVVKEIPPRGTLELKTAAGLDTVAMIVLSSVGEFYLKECHPSFFGMAGGYNA